MGTDYLQGFLYARPMPEEQFLNFLKSHAQDTSPDPVKSLAKRAPVR